MLGGTFNPVHNGHLAVAGEVMRRLKLDEVWFLPAGQPWMKTGEPVTDAAHRVRMLRLATRGKHDFRVSTLEVERPGATYTVETMSRLRAMRGRGDELYFIMSRATLAQLPGWREPARLINLCRLVVVPRPGTPEPDLGALAKLIPGLSPRVIFLDKPLVDISATDIRRRVARGEGIGELVPAAVARYIKEHGLYRGNRF
ncbi:MAG: nicotinate-nucleotide adenylyltransferase [Chloroflexota bacterium]